MTERESAADILIRIFTDKVVSPMEAAELCAALASDGAELAKTELGGKLQEAIDELRANSQAKQNRLLCACSALKGILASEPFMRTIDLAAKTAEHGAHIVAEAAVCYADALLAALDRLPAEGK